MSDLPALLTSIAAVISAASGMVIGVLALVRGSPRERRQAAQAALDRITGKPEDAGSDQDKAQWAAIEEIRRHLGSDS